MTKFLLTFTFIISYFFSMMGICLKRKNILMILLMLEFLTLIMIGLIFIYLLTLIMDKYIILYYLIFCVCEGALGLSLLISMIRFYGNDFFLSLTMLKC